MPVGIDIVCLERFNALLKEFPEFLKLILNKVEIESPDKAFAASFAAKEALLKALPFDVNLLQLHSLSLLRRTNGRPYFEFDVSSQESIFLDLMADVSISYSCGHVVAVVIVQEYRLR